jgi:hypothetical protein
MERYQPVIEPDELVRHILRITHRNKVSVAASLERARRLASDEDREKRLNVLLCPYCYYAPATLHGAAMTYTNCRCCDGQIISGSTHTDEFCPACAKKHNMCKECGADLDLKEPLPKKGKHHR